MVSSILYCHDVDILPTFLYVVNDVLAEQVIVTEHYRRAQLRQVFLHPHHFLFKHFLTGHFLLNS